MEVQIDYIRCFHVRVAVWLLSSIHLIRKFELSSCGCFLISKLEWIFDSVSRLLGYIPCFFSAKTCAPPWKLDVRSLGDSSIHTSDHRFLLGSWQAWEAPSAGGRHGNSGQRFRWLVHQWERQMAAHEQMSELPTGWQRMTKHRFWWWTFPEKNKITNKLIKFYVAINNNYHHQVAYWHGQTCSPLPHIYCSLQHHVSILDCQRIFSCCLPLSLFPLIFPVVIACSAVLL